MLHIYTIFFFIAFFVLYFENMNKHNKGHSSLNQETPSKSQRDQLGAHTLEGAMTFLNISLSDI